MSNNSPDFNSTELFFKAVILVSPAMYSFPALIILATTFLSIGDDEFNSTFTSLIVIASRTNFEFDEQLEPYNWDNLCNHEHLQNKTNRHLSFVIILCYVQVFLPNPDYL